MNEHLQRHLSVPPFTRDLQACDQLKWSAPFEVPALGTDVIVRLNAVGRARVVGYASYEGYLGVMCIPYHPPAWWISQNGQPTMDNAALTFGAEIALIGRVERSLEA